MREAITIGRVDDLAEGEAKSYEVGDKRIAVFHVGGEFRAIDDACPHAGASLADGYLEDGKVGCPWHYAEFDLTTGKHLQAPATCGVAVHKIVVGDGQLKVILA